MEIEEIKNEQIYDLVKELLPQLEQDIRKQVEDQMNQEYQMRLQYTADQVQQDALNELDAIFMQVQTETQKQFTDKIQELEQREKEIDDEFNNLEVVVRQEIENKVKSTFEQEKKMLVTTIIDEINKQGFNEDIEMRIKDKLRQEQEEEIKKEMQKKEKIMKVNLSKKLETEKKQLEEFYRLEIKAKIDKEKSLLVKEKSELARLKSLKNIKVNKLEEEKNKIKEQLQDQEKKYNIIVDNLQNQIKDITIQIERYRKDTNIKGILKNNSLLNLNQNQHQQTIQQDQFRSSFHSNQTSGDGVRSNSTQNQFNYQVNKENNYTLNRKNSNFSVNGLNQQQNIIGQQEDLEFQKKYLTNSSKNPFLISQTQNNNLFEYHQTGQIIQEQNQPAAFAQQQQHDNKNNNENIHYSFDPLSPPPQNYQKNIQDLTYSGQKSPPMQLIGQPKSSLEIYKEYQKKQEWGVNGKKSNMEDLEVVQNGLDESMNRIKDEQLRDRVGSSSNNNQHNQEENQTQSMNRSLNLADSLSRKGESIKDRVMKEKKQNIEQNIKQNECQYDKYIAIESYLQQQFIDKLRATYTQKENITELIQNLIDAWNYRYVSYSQRIEFIGKLEYIQQDFDAIFITLNSHYENIREDIMLSQKLIEIMSQRENILISQYQQQQISSGQSFDPDQFEQSARLTATKVNQEIKLIDLEIISLINEFQTIYKKPFIWQGFLLKDLIEVELWQESQQAHDLQDIKSIILNKLQNKFY